MPYIPPHLRPGYVSTYLPPPVKTGARFPTDVNDHATNVVPNNGTRHVPRANALPVKKTLKAVRKITPNAAPAYKPSHRVKNWPDAFRKYAISKIGKKETTRKSKKKCKGTRKGRKGKCTRRRDKRKR